MLIISQFLLRLSTWSENLLSVTTKDTRRVLFMLRLSSDRSFKQLLAEPYSTVDIALSLRELNYISDGRI